MAAVHDGNPPKQIVMKPSTMSYSDTVEVAEYCGLHMRVLRRERQKITQRGRLTGDEDLRLDEIDAELEYWEDILNELGVN